VATAAEQVQSVGTEADAPPCATVIIDTYNQASYIDEAVASVLAQEKLPGPLEVIIVDDGSTDGTAERLIRYHNKANVIRKDNGGQASALNAGLAQSSSDIIMLLDGDDYWHPEKVAKVLDLFAQHSEASMVYHGIEQSSGIDWWGAVSREAVVDIIDRPEALLQCLLPPTSALSFRKSHIARLLPIPSDLWFCADAYLGWLAPFCGHVVSSGDRLAVYRLHDNNLFLLSDHSWDKLTRRYYMLKAALRHVFEWLASSEFDTNSYPIREYLRRFELYVETLSFDLQSPGRLRWMRHKALHISLERQCESRRYVVFHALIAILAGALGYERTLRAWKLYSQSRLLLAARRLLAPSAQEASEGKYRSIFEVEKVRSAGWRLAHITASWLHLGHSLRHPHGQQPQLVEHSGHKRPRLGVHHRQRW
jgi:glycosyltransferase involved in cell wall biosynthesis